jgi:hypothetical protein
MGTNILEEPAATIFSYPEDGGRIFLHNIGTHWLNTQYYIQDHHNLDAAMRTSDFMKHVQFMTAYTG